MHQHELGFAGGRQPVEHRSQVVVLRLQAVEPAELVVAPAEGDLAEVRICLFREREVVQCVTPTRLVGLAEDLEALGAYSRIVSSIQ